MRRTGKEVLEALWEATQSHVVASHKAAASAAAAPAAMPAAPTEGKPAGRRSTRRVAAPAAPPPTPPASQAPIKAADGNGASRVRASLILVEDIDVVYEEDRGIWAALEQLIDNSKRPIVLTCSGAVRTKEPTGSTPVFLTAPGHIRLHFPTQNTRIRCGKHSSAGRTRRWRCRGCGHRGSRRICTPWPP